MKLIASTWVIPIVFCLLGSAYGDELTTLGDAKSLGFSTARLARIAPWYQAGQVAGLVLNPGPWEQKAAMIAPGAK
jgi:hypothetical protein